MLTIRELSNADHDDVRWHLARCWRETYTKIIGTVQVEEMVASLDKPDLGMFAPPSARQFSVVVLKSSSEANAFYQALGFSPTATVDHELSAGLTVPAMTMVSSRIGK